MSIPTPRERAQRLEVDLLLRISVQLDPEEMEGGYTRYISEDLPGFRILCEPNENPIPLIERAMEKFIPVYVKGVRVKCIQVKVD